MGHNLCFLECLAAYEQSLGSDEWFRFIFLGPDQVRWKLYSGIYIFLNIFLFQNLQATNFKGSAIFFYFFFIFRYSGHAFGVFFCFTYIKKKREKKIFKQDITIMPYRFPLHMTPELNIGHNGSEPWRQRVLTWDKPSDPSAFRTLGGKKRWKLWGNESAIAIIWLILIGFDWTIPGI